MSPRASALAAALLWASTASAQHIRVRTRLGRFGPLVLTVCPDDPPAEAWRRHIREEFDDRTVHLYEPSAETEAIHPDFRVVLRAARCAGDGTTYELALSDARGELVQGAMVSMAGVPRDERPQVAALRIAEAFRTHRFALVGADPPARVIDVSAPPPPGAPWDAEFGLGARVIPSSGFSMLTLHLAAGRQPNPTSRQRLRFELGGSANLDRLSGAFRVWLASGWAWTAWRSRRVELAVGARAELAVLVSAWFPTLVVGATTEVQFAADEGVWLWARLDLGGHVIGATFYGADVETGFTAALTAGARLGL